LVGLGVIAGSAGAYGIGGRLDHERPYSAEAFSAWSGEIWGRYGGDMGRYMGDIMEI